MLRRLAHVARSFDQADSPDEVLKALKAMADPAGVSLFGIGRPPMGKADGNVGLFTGAVPNLVKDWNGEFLRKGPSLPGRYAQAKNPPPFTSVEAMRRLQPSGDDRWVFDLIRDHRIKDSLWCSSGPWLVVFLADRTLTRAVLSSETDAALDSASAMAIRRLKEISHVNARGPELTPRQRTVLQHLSDGLNVHEIAARLGVSEQTIKTLSARAVKGLDARTQLHAVAVAVRERLI